MGIPVGKLSLYTTLGGIRPSTCLCVTIDVGTNNEDLLNDEFYIGLRRRRATGQVKMVKHAWLIDILIRFVQFEDFANHNAFDLLAKYGATHLVFNDDIQVYHRVLPSGLEFHSAISPTESNALIFLQPSSLSGLVCNLCRILLYQVVPPSFYSYFMP
ncbi:hypothetical protein POM88_009040 [Heracleum sosnowskyi]|uniref:Malic enzyme N-terminal domain-containing protein n=1 Tax=Heracleum sosnowskyi TaxID=360622 RepID=A0AAD8JB68_9APIA|nr:hypothetical protein POM88_009040 [Heracleum sosnowskyi]